MVDREALTISYNKWVFLNFIDDERPICIARIIAAHA